MNNKKRKSREEIKTNYDKGKVNKMIIDKEKGNIIFETGEVLKPLMTLDEVKASSIMNLLRNETPEDIDKNMYLRFEPFTCYGSTVYMDAVMFSKKVGKITICLDESANLYEDPYYDKKFSMLIDRHKNFIKKALQIDEVKDYENFKWGYVHFSANFRDAFMEIEIHYDFDLDNENSEDLWL